MEFFALRMIYRQSVFDFEVLKYFLASGLIVRVVGVKLACFFDAGGSLFDLIGGPESLRPSVVRLDKCRVNLNCFVAVIDALLVVV